ncbi:hypothetical protein NHX12_031153 [Muraenolepis orangiensis]|uniref:PKD domain-containing protein n=1 Tax=Muraenolepis orangiensis TaxID=630683 RepID=A0A9Q0EAX5_9TELE|nr:hypothetical protein NHX12_031153 [Muraenolepis orangiensis]
MGTLTLLVLVLAFTSATVAKSKVQFTRYRSWNSRMYPVWRDGDSRFRNCWFGGEVTFEVKNDAPTLTGAKATFNIDLRFPPNQTVLPDGQVVWARNATIDGREYEEGQAVYADQEGNRNGVFPDGSSFTSRSPDKKPRYVFVWKTWGRYWQVADGPSSSLTIGTDNIPLGSYKMEVVIYHCRGDDKFIPLGYASTQFSITDQIPFTISLNQVTDVNQNDQSFIQNRAIAFNVKLHDPSLYLSSSDITFNWDFGDQTGTLISRELTVTHTYLSPGAFKPQVVLMATIPNGCADTTAVVPVDASAAPIVVVLASTASTIPAENPSAVAPEGDATALDEATLADDLALAASVQPAEGTEVAADPEAEAAAVPAAEEADAAVALAAEVAVDTVEVDTAAEGAEVGQAVEVDQVVPATEEAVEAAEDAAEAAVAPAAEDAAEAAVAPAAEDAAEAAVAPAAEDAAEAAVAPAAEDAVEAAVAPAAEDAVEVAVAPVAEDTIEAAVAPAAEDAVEATVAPVAEDAVEAAVAPAAEDAVEAAVAPAAEEAVEATVAPAAENAVEAPADETAVVTDAAVTDAVAVEVEEAPVAEAATAAPAPEEEEAVEEVEAVAAVTEAAQADNVLVPAATESTEVVEVAEVEPEVNAEAEVAETVNEVAVPTVAVNEGAVPTEVAAEAGVDVDVETEPAQVVLVLTKRQAPQLTADCDVYRYGSLATSVDIIQGIESVEILQVTNVVSLTTELEQNAVDLTISCQGSLPSEVCTIISDADCVTPVETVCAVALPTPDCQLVLRQFFNDSGVFCINVSLTNDVSLAVASARVSVTVGSSGSPAGTAAAIMGVMVLVGIVGTIGLMYRRAKQYQPLREESSGVSTITAVPLLLWNLLSRQSPGESRPLLQGRGV